MKAHISFAHLDRAEVDSLSSLFRKRTLDCRYKRVLRIVVDDDVKLPCMAAKDGLQCSKDCRKVGDGKLGASHDAKSVPLQSLRGCGVDG